MMLFSVFLAAAVLHGCGGGAPAALPEAPLIPDGVEESQQFTLDFSGPAGGPFTSSNASPSLTNGLAELELSTSSSSNWVTLTVQPAGPIPAGAQYQLVAQVNASLVPFDPSTYEAVLTATRASDQFVVARIEVALTVQPDQGWTAISPSVDTRRVYVSSSLGSDANTGATPQSPKKTLEAARAALRPSMPDHIYLRRGDVWVGEFIYLNSGGRSADEPLLITSYGDDGPRPKLVDGYVRANFQSEVSHLAIVGLHLAGGDGATPDSGITYLGNGTGLLVEDCFVEGYKDNLIISGHGGQLEHVRIRRNLVVDSFSDSGGHSQGMYMDNCHDVLLEGNVFDHNGWREGVAGAEPTIFNHNMYIQKNCSQVTVRNNISARASSHGLQQRPGGDCRSNLFIANPIGLGFGHSEIDFAEQQASGQIAANVVIGSRNIGTQPRGMGIWVQNVDDVTMEQNAVVHLGPGTQPHAIRADTSYRNLRIRDNVVFDWHNSSADIPGVGLFLLGNALQNISVSGNFIQQPGGGEVVTHSLPTSPLAVSYSGNTYYSAFHPNLWFIILGNTGGDFQSFTTVMGDQTSTNTQHSFSDPTRTVATYWEFRGQQGGREGFLGALRGRAPGTWPYILRPENVVEYILDGYDRSPSAD